MHGILFREDGLISVGNRLYTNRHKVPLEIVVAILKDRYTTEGEASSDYSASKLVQPVQKTVLEERYKWNGKNVKDYKLKVFDVMDDFWSFQGSISHQVIEETWHENMGGVVEERLYMDVCGEVLSGKMDRYIDGVIKDYKNTKVYKVMKGDYTDWAIQQNIYAQLCRENGWPVKQIQIVAMLTNWQEGESTYKANYPECAVQVVPIRVWDEADIKAWIVGRVATIQKAFLMDDQTLADLVPCSDAERWKNYQGTAVMKRDGKKASFLAKPEQGTVEENYQAALDWLDERGLGLAEYTVDVRWSEPKRCLKWCSAAAVCKQWEAEKDEHEG